MTVSSGTSSKNISGLGMTRPSVVMSFKSLDVNVDQPFFIPVCFLKSL